MGTRLLLGAVIAVGLASPFALAGCSTAVTVAPPQPPTLQSVQAEIVALHRFFEQWFRADLSGDDAAFAPLPNALADGFVIVGPGGVAMERDTVLQGVRGAHGSWGPSDKIWIEDVRIRRAEAGTIVATYEEWQRRGGEDRGRLSTVVFSPELRWLHVHETWLPAP